MNDPMRHPPLPADLTSAQAEIRTLQRILYSERERIAKIVMLREQDRRSNAGNMQALRDELDELMVVRNTLGYEVLTLREELDKKNAVIDRMVEELADMTIQREAHKSPRELNEAEVYIEVEE